MTKKLLCYAVAAALLPSCSSGGKQEEQEEEKTTMAADEKPVEVKAMLLEPADFNFELVSNGTVEAVRKAKLQFQTQEAIAKIHVKNGQRVAQGQKLAELETFRLKNSMAQARESRERAELDLQDVLIGQGYALADSSQVPPEVMRIAKIRSNYDQAVNNYRLAAYNLDAATLYAPFDGVVADLTAKEFNKPSGEAFCLIIDNQHPEVVFHVLENELDFINPGDKVAVSPFSGTGYTTEGRITEINPVIDKNGMVRIKAEATNRDNKLYEGMNVKVRVQRLLGKQLVIPKTALVLRTNRKVVFTLKEGRAMWNYVETAQENSSGYVVTDGLAAGDSVIYEGNFNLADRVPVVTGK